MTGHFSDDDLSGYFLYSMFYICCFVYKKYIILSSWTVNFPDETGKMSEGQKGGGTAEVQKKPAREGSRNDIFYDDDGKYALIGHKDARSEI